MIPVLRSIDSLFNRFDELSKYHANLLSAFDANFSDVENPLRNVTRTEDEQRKTAANILLAVNENDDQIGSIQTIEDFHRRIIKNRYLHRPPSYSSNDSSLLCRVPSRTSSIATDLSSFTQISQTTIKASTPQPVIPISNKNFIEPKIKLTTKIKPKPVLQNPPTPRRYARGAVTAFSKETVDRLSKPKAYNQLPDQCPTIKRVQRRPKPSENIKKEVSECSTSSIPPPIKRIKTTTKPSSKKLKVENKTLSRPFIFVAPAPTIHLTFPTQPSTRIGIFPKTSSTNKRSMIHLKT
jgi:hypothetical protein